MKISKKIYNSHAHHLKNCSVLYIGFCYTDQLNECFAEQLPWNYSMFLLLFPTNDGDGYCFGILCTFTGSAYYSMCNQTKKINLHN
jgi:hypothetical protein